MCKKLIYLVSFICLLGLANNSSADIPIDPNLVIYYSYDDVGLIVPDESGRGHHGTVCGDISGAPSGIKWFGAAEFQGIWGPTGYSYLDLDSPHYPAEDIPKSAITLAVWCKCRDTTGLPGTDHHAIMSTRASDDTWVMHPQINNDGTFRWLLRKAGKATIFNLDHVGSHGWDEWIHYAGTYDSVTGKGILYIDGDVCESINVTPGQLIADWGTGARVGYNIDNARPFTGIMDELYLYTRALSQDEIKELMVSDGLPTEKASHPSPVDGAELEAASTILLWLPGAYAVSNDLYFGESFKDVNDGTGDTFKGNLTDAQFIVTDLAWGKSYYWRIDGVNPDDANSPWKGDVWSFLLHPPTAWNPNPSDGAKWIDPNAVLSWSPGSNSIMYYVYFGDTFDDVNNATGAPYQFETTYEPAGPLEFEKVYYWRVDEFDQSGTTHTGDIWSFTTRRADSGLKGEYYKGDFKTLVLNRTDPGINFDWGAGSPDTEVPADDFSARWTGELEVPFTSDWTFTSSCNDWVRLWVNDQLLFDKWGLQSGVEWIGIINLVAGQKYSIVMEYHESSGDAYAKLYWNSPSWLSPYQPKQIIPQGAFSLSLKARNPKPINGTVGVRLTDVLTWQPGDNAASHEVYFGENEDAVRNADKNSPEYKGAKGLGDETYDPGKLAWDTTYYWRVDEVNEANPDSPWIGNLWSFATGDFFVLDDFESYDAGNNQIWYVWLDGLGYGTLDNPPYYTGNGTGSAVGDETTPSYCEEKIVHGGRKAMPMSYDNNKQGYAKYSEVEIVLSETRNWTDEGVDELSLWFHGNSSNSADPLYVAIANKTGTPVVVEHDDPSAAQIEAWTEWIIPLQSFADGGIDLTDVDKIMIGLGTKGNLTTPGEAGKMIFDDIWLVRSVETAE
ncbi:MAG: hypothetical protein JXA81_14265 [Sedimentisphaerales bacterium]|nr:hypothetical protein [Sedimentisphaerales bacterium]